jgi:hypothetical protein
MRRAGRFLTYANVCATLALFVAVSGGVSWAAGQLIGGKDIQSDAISARLLAKGSVTSRAVKDHSLKAVDFAKGQLPAGARGATGAQGAAGPTGAPGAPGASRVARFVYSVNEGVNGISTFTLERTIGTFTLGAAGTIDVRWMTALHGLSIAGAGDCEVQLRVDGRTDQGTTPTGNDGSVGGTIVLHVPMQASPVDDVADEAWFPNLTAGHHSLEIWMRSTSGAVACDEPGGTSVPATTGQAYVSAIG